MFLRVADGKAGEIEGMMINIAVINLVFDAVDTVGYGFESLSIGHCRGGCIEGDGCLILPCT